MSTHYCPELATKLWATIEELTTKQDFANKKISVLVSKGNNSSFSASKRQNGCSLDLENPNSNKFSALLPVDEVELAIFNNKLKLLVVTTIIEIVALITNIVTVTVVESIILIIRVVRTIVIIITVIPLLLRAVTVEVTLPKIILKPPPATLLVTHPQK
jgi:hypothetical protein